MKLNNETEFILSNKLKTGFTVVTNDIINCGMTYNAVGLYMTIIQKANIPNWKVYQSTLINNINKRTATKKGLDELIEFGLLEKVQLRDEKGRMQGVKYIINDTPRISKEYKTSSPESVGMTASQPNAKIPLSVKPTSVKQHLINKDNKKERLIINKESSSKRKDEDDEKIELLIEKTLGAFSKAQFKKFLKETNGDIDIVIDNYEIALEVATADKNIKNLAGYVMACIKNDM